MRRALVLALAAALAAATACGGSGEPGPARLAGARPDVVLVLTDDQRWDTLGVTGGPAPTPNLDWLAEQGVRIDDATVPTPRCVPSRASLLTGRYAHAHGALDNQPAEDPLADEELLPELLQRAGYETAFFGKWHLPNPGARPYRGFDHFVSFELQGEYVDQTLIVDGEPVPTRGFQTDVLAERAAAWLRRPRERPAFLMLALKNCHAPFEPPPRHVGTVPPERVELPASLDDPSGSLPEHLRAQARSGLAVTGGLSREYLRSEKAAYLELVPSVDDAVHRLLQALHESDRWGRTLFVFTSDNGFLWGEHGLLSKSTCFEPSIRVPLIAAWPGALPAGRVERRPASIVDLAPTLLELAGAPIPAAVQGRSLLPLLAGTDAPWRTATLHHEPLREGHDRPEELCLRGARWKYTRWSGEHAGERLIDLSSDPDERVDLSSRPEHAARLRELRAALDAEAERLGLPRAWLGR